jgi:hypothetical protein
MNSTAVIDFWFNEGALENFSQFDLAPLSPKRMGSSVKPSYCQSAAFMQRERRRIARDFFSPFSCVIGTTTRSEVFTCL